MTDPIALMLQCHERIHRFLGGLLRLAELDDLGDPRAPDAAAACARYFREGLPLHGADEDLSMAPRLRARDVAPGVVRALERMGAEHVRMEEILPDILGMLDRIAAGEAPDPAPLRHRVPPFRDLMLEHMALEEDVIFPACAVLDEDDRRAIVLEIRARRSA